MGALTRMMAGFLLGAGIMAYSSLTGHGPGMAAILTILLMMMFTRVESASVLYRIGQLLAALTFGGVMTHLALSIALNPWLTGLVVLLMDALAIIAFGQPTAEATDAD